MFSLIKKDFITSIKVRTIIYVLLMIYVISTLGYILPIPLPMNISFLNGSIILGIVIAYFSIMNTFYYDNFNKSNEFILSIPTKREDIVLAKYSYSLILIIIALLIVSLFGGIKAFEVIGLAKLVEFKDIAFTMAVLLLSFSIILPLIYKYGYEKIRMGAPLILVVFYVLTINIFKPIETKLKLMEQYGTFPITISGASMAQNYSKFYTFLVDGINIKVVNYTTVAIFALLIFIISMFISVRVYKKNGVV